MRTGGFEAFVFSCKAALAAAAAYLFYGLLPFPGGVWASVTAVIVLQEALHPSLNASLLRLRANIVGCLIGSLLATLLGHTLIALCLGILLTGMTCHFTRLDEGLRPAYVAVLIVVLTGETNAWHGSIDRVLAVLIGCASAIVASLLLDRLIGRYVGNLKKYVPTLEQQE